MYSPQLLSLLNLTEGMGKNSRMPADSHHNPQVPHPGWGRNVDVMHYTVADESVSTGRHVLHLPTALDRADAFLEEVERL